MSGETHVTIVGRLIADPELRFTPSGAAVANLTIASNARTRTFDKAANEWRDEPATFWRCSAWREMAENVAESLLKGSPVIAMGVIKSREWQTKEGEKRTSMEVTLDAIGPDLRWAVARPVKAQRGSATGGWAANSPVKASQDGLGATNSPSGHSDPWATPSAPQNATPQLTDEPPF
jgi:single-strand DNA-binding protein